MHGGEHSVEAAAADEGAHGGHAVSADPKHVQMFFVIYFIMTGMHAFHMIIGAGLLTWLIILSLKGHFGPHNFMKLECTGFYWHFVDIVWIFLFPLLYLLNPVGS